MKVSNSVYLTKDKRYTLNNLSSASETNLIVWSYLQWSEGILKSSLVNTNLNCWMCREMEKVLSLIWLWQKAFKSY